jgi:MFS family permease
MAGGLLTPMAQMMMAQVAGRHMARIFGYMAMPVLIAPLLGPIVAGVILKYAAWPWLFYINLPVGMVAVVTAAILLPADQVASQKSPFDLLGFLLIAPGLTSFLYGLDRASHAEGSGALLAGVLLMSGFVWHALRKHRAALIDVRLFKNRIFSTATTTMFLSNGASFAGQLLIPLYLVTGCGLSPSNAGWMLAPMGLGMMCSYPSMGSLTDKFGCRAVSVTGTILVVLGTLPFLWMIQNNFSPALMVVSLFVRGAGQAAIGIPSLSAAYASVPKDKLALATTAINIVQRLGGPVATTIIATVLSLSAVHFPASGPHAFFIAFIALFVLHMLALSAATFLPARIHQQN